MTYISSIGATPLPPSAEQIFIPKAKQLSLYRKCLIRFAHALDLNAPRFAENHHALEWRQQALNYWRCVEMPLAYQFLASESISGKRLLDLGSPKLLPLCLAELEAPSELVTSDISDYFVEDLGQWKAERHLDRLSIQICDARQLPFGDAAFDAVLSVSMVEHIPDDGDTRAVCEMARVLRKDGQIVLTVPFKHEYLEEFQHTGDLYWAEHTVERDGELFYQRRYDWKAFHERILAPAQLEIRKMVLIGERPVSVSSLPNNDGRMVENWNVFESLPAVKFAKRLGKKLRLNSEQWIYSGLSRRYHYFTGDIFDPQAMCLVVALGRRA